METNIYIYILFEYNTTYLYILTHARAHAHTQTEQLSPLNKWVCQLARNLPGNFYRHCPIFYPINQEKQRVSHALRLNKWLAQYNIEFAILLIISTVKLSELLSLFRVRFTKKYQLITLRTRIIHTVIQRRWIGELNIVFFYNNLKMFNG